MPQDQDRDQNQRDLPYRGKPDVSHPRQDAQIEDDNHQWHDSHDFLAICSAIEDLIGSLEDRSPGVMVAIDSSLRKKLRPAIDSIRAEAYQRSHGPTIFDVAEESAAFLRVGRGLVDSLRMVLVDVGTSDVEAYILQTQRGGQILQSSISMFVGFTATRILSGLSNVPGYDPASLAEVANVEHGGQDSGICLRLSTLTGKICAFRARSTTTILEIKEVLYIREGLPVGQQHLVFRGRGLQNDLTVGYYNINSSAGDKIYLILPIWHWQWGRDANGNMRSCASRDEFDEHQMYIAMERSLEEQ